MSNWGPADPLPPEAIAELSAAVGPETPEAAYLRAESVIDLGAALRRAMNRRRMSERDQRIAMRRLLWGGEEQQPTLRRVGKEFSLSVESVRQICCRAQQYLSFELQERAEPPAKEQELNYIPSRIDPAIIERADTPMGKPLSTALLAMNAVLQGSNPRGYVEVIVDQRAYLKIASEVGAEPRIYSRGVFTFTKDGIAVNMVVRGGLR